MEEYSELFQESLASYYNRSLDSVPVYPLTDNPVMASLRGIYTRTDLCHAPGWPPMEDQECFTDYSRLFVVRLQFFLFVVGGY